ncbi:MAG: hypothetical protein P8Y06_02310 [Patescibacteria group bacterium]
MLDIQFIRENSEKVKKGVKAKQLYVKIVDKVIFQLMMLKPGKMKVRMKF